MGFFFCRRNQIISDRLVSLVQRDINQDRIIDIYFDAICRYAKDNGGDYDAGIASLDFTCGQATYNASFQAADGAVNVFLQKYPGVRKHKILILDDDFL